MSSFCLTFFINSSSYVFQNASCWSFLTTWSYSSELTPAITIFYYRLTDQLVTLKMSISLSLSFLKCSVMTYPLQSSDIYSYSINDVLINLLVILIVTLISHYPIIWNCSPLLHIYKAYSILSSTLKSLYCLLSNSRQFLLNRNKVLR